MGDADAQFLPPFQKVPGASSVPGPTSFSPPYLAQELIQHLGVGLVLGDGALGNAFAVAAAERLERGLILGPHQWLKLFPGVVRGREHLVGLGGGAQEALAPRLVFSLAQPSLNT